MTSRQARLAREQWNAEPGAVRALMRRKLCSVAKKAVATQRAGIVARQRQTRRLRIHTPDCELSIKIVVAR